jgi:hypothetical protein
MTPVVQIIEANIAATAIFWWAKIKMEPRRERMLKDWKNSPKEGEKGHGIRRG